MSAAADRVRDFLDARAQMSGLDPEVIAGAAVGGELYELTTRDLRELLGEIAANEAEL